MKRITGSEWVERLGSETIQVADAVGSAMMVVLDTRLKTPPLEAERFIESIPQWQVQQ